MAEQKLREEHAYIEAAIIMLHADGLINDEEVTKLEAELKSQPQLSKLTPDQITHLIHRSVTDIEQEGIDARIEAIDAALETKVQKLEALNVALTILMADRDVDINELDIFKRMQYALGLTDTEVAPLLKQHFG